MSRTTWLAVPFVALAALTFTAVGMADPGDKDHGKGSKPAKSHGNNTFTFTMANTDNGSCSNGSTDAWAVLQEQRTFTVRKTKDGYRLTRTDRGTFVTRAGASPGSCESGNHGTAVLAGVKGKFHGKIVGTVTGGTFNPNATCTTDCNTREGFLAAYFGSGAVYSCDVNSKDCKFDFEYSAPAQTNPKLLFHHWSDKGKGAGTMLQETFKGDIANS
jgi:hypothetical protein